MSRKNVCLSVMLLLICWAGITIPASAQHFQQITGTLSQVAAGRAEVWGINTSQKIYRLNSSTKTFTHSAGWPALTQIAVGGGTSVQGDEVWGLNASGAIYRFNLSTKMFSAVTGVLSQIVVGEGVTDNCHPYEVWGINPLSNVYRYNYCTSAFDQVTIPNPFTHITTGGGSIWGLDEFAQIWQFNFYNQSFSQIAGSLQAITVGANQVWGLDGIGNTYRFEEGVGFTGYGLGALQIAAGGDGVWVIDLGNEADVFVSNYYPGLYGDTFVGIPSSLVQIAVGSGAGVWGVNSSHQVFVFERP